MIRATGLASATGLSTGGVESGGVWEGKTDTPLQALSHAAALDADLYIGKVLDGSGNGSESAVIAGMEWAANTVDPT